MNRKLQLINFFIFGYVLVVAGIILTYTIMDNFQQKAESPIPDPLPQVTNPDKTLAVHGAIPYWEQEKGFATFRDNVSEFDYISLFWYYITPERNIVRYKDAVEDQDIISFAHENNVKVLAVITNLPEEEGTTWDSQRVRRLISTPQNRSAHIKDIIQLLDAKNFDGVNIDYEELDDDLRDEFSAFIQELSQELHMRGKLVGVALHPKSGEFIPAEDNGSRAQDWQAIGKSADHLYLMTYGEHWNDSTAGPVASIPWDSKILAHVQRLGLPLQKVYLGVPLYGVRWKENTKSGEGLLYEDIQQLTERFDVKPAWNDRWKSPMLRYADNSTNYVVWYEDAKSFKEKFNLAEKNGIGGISFWHIGGEDPEVWSSLKEL